MAELTAQRTLVKSPPELWAELSEVESLAKHLGEFGEIRITKTKPETTVAWEGEQISGTVVLKQSGWGTKVTFHATVPEPEPVEDAISIPDSDPEPEAEVLEKPRVDVSEPAVVAEVAVEPEPEPAVAVEAEAAVEAETVMETEPEPEVEAEPKRRGFIARWLFRERSPAAPAARRQAADVEAAVAEVVAEPEPPAPAAEAVREEPAAEPALPEEPAVAAIAAERAQQVLDSVLENLGQAHHRPFSRG